MNHRLRLTHLLACLAAIVLASLACVVEAGIERTPTPNAALDSTVQAMRAENDRLATVIAMPTSPPSLTPQSGTQEVTPQSTTVPAASPTPTLAPPRFTNLRFSTQPEAEQSQRFYVAGTGRIYAIWDYQEMEEGLRMRREWRLNGEIYRSVQETWDFERFGESGTLRGVSIFDDESGLPAGEYTLTLYINDQPQPETGSFWLFRSDINQPVASPDRSHTAIVTGGGRLAVEDPNGNIQVWVVTQEISSIAWLPDGRHLVYADRDRSRQVNEVEDWGITHKLWILDTENGDRNLVGASGENFRSPVVSPDGRYIAVLVGHTKVEGCQASPGLAILELDSEFKRLAVFVLDDFSGLTSPHPDGGIYPDLRRPPLRWENDSRLLANLWWSCLDVPPSGQYRLDMTNMRATRTGN